MVTSEFKKSGKSKSNSVQGMLEVDKAANALRQYKRASSDT